MYMLHTYVNVIYVCVLFCFLEQLYLEIIYNKLYLFKICSLIIYNSGHVYTHMKPLSPSR